MKIDWDSILKDVERREWICRFPPLCTKCGHEQVQIIDSHVIPAKWKCRVCHWSFDHEPYIFK